MLAVPQQPATSKIDINPEYLDPRTGRLDYAKAANLLVDVAREQVSKFDLLPRTAGQGSCNRPAFEDGLVGIANALEGAIGKLLVKPLAPTEFDWRVRPEQVQAAERRLTDSQCLGVLYLEPGERTEQLQRMVGRVAVRDALVQLSVAYGLSSRASNQLDPFSSGLFLRSALVNMWASGLARLENKELLRQMVMGPQALEAQVAVRALGLLLKDADTSVMTETRLFNVIYEGDRSKAGMNPWSAKVDWQTQSIATDRRVHLTDTLYCGLFSRHSEVVAASRDAITALGLEGVSVLLAGHKNGFLSTTELAEAIDHATAYKQIFRVIPPGEDLRQSGLVSPTNLEDLRTVVAQPTVGDIEASQLYRAIEKLEAIFGRPGEG